MRGTNRRPTHQPASALLGTSDPGRWLAALEQAQAVLELGDAELELLDLRARDEPELAEEPAEAVTGPLAQPHRLVAPTADQLLDDRASFLAPHPTARGQLLDERVRPLSGQRNGADAREDKLLRELPGGISGLGHGVLRVGAGGGVPASPARRPRRPGSRPRSSEWPRPQPPPRRPRARPLRPPCRPRRPGIAPCGARTPARAPSRRSAAAPR